MATDRFHKDKKARAALHRAVARAREHDGDRVRLERSDTGQTLEPVDSFFERIATDYEPEIQEVSAPVSQTYIHPDPDRRALVDQWLADNQRHHAA